MMKRALLFFMTGFCLVLAAPLVLAAEQAQTATAQEKPLVPITTVLQNLKMNGYDLVSQVELDDDVFVIEAMTPQGNKLKITVDAHTGEIIKPKENPIPRVSLVEVVKRVEGSGYHDISSIEFSGGKYIVRAMDEKEKKVKLKIDGATGEISKPWF